MSPGGADASLERAILVALDGLLAALELEPAGDDRFRVGQRARALRPGLRRADRRPGAASRRARPSTDKDPHSLHAYFVEAGTPDAAARARGRPGARRPVDLHAARDRHAGRTDAPDRDGLVPRQPHGPRARRPAARRSRRPTSSPCCRTGCATLPPELRPHADSWVEQPPPLDLRIGEAPNFLGGPPADGRALALDAPAARRRRRPAAAHRAARVRQRLPAARHGVPLVPGARSRPTRSPASASTTRSGSTARSASTAGTSTPRRRWPSRAIAAWCGARSTTPTGTSWPASCRRCWSAPHAEPTRRRRRP